jgi:hypothetical protein
MARVQGQCQAFDFGLVFSLAIMRYGRALRARGLDAGEWLGSRATGLECVDLILYMTSTIKTWVRYPAMVSMGRARGEMDSENSTSQKRAGN